MHASLVSKERQHSMLLAVLLKVRLEGEIAGSHGRCHCTVRPPSELSRQ